MKKKQKMKKKPATKKAKKKVPVKRSTDVNIRVSVKQEPVQPSLLPAIVDPATLEPMKGEGSGSKYMIPKTWMSDKQVVQMVQKTPPQYIYRRQGKGGQTFDYVTGWYVTKVLNYVFGWNWDFEIIDKGREQDQVWVLGKLTVKDDKGHTIVKSQFGRADIKFFKAQPNRPVDYGNDLKAAATDALKKCASELGVASDIYGKAEFVEDGNKPIVPTQPSAPAPKAPQGAKPSEPERKAPPAASNSPAREKLFKLAREYGAVAGKETKIIEAALKLPKDKKIPWGNLTEQELELIYSKYLAKIVK